MTAGREQRVVTGQRPLTQDLLRNIVGLAMQTALAEAGGEDGIVGVDPWRSNLKLDDVICAFTDRLWWGEMWPASDRQHEVPS